MDTSCGIGWGQRSFHYCVCGYINVSCDLRQELGLCSEASGGQIGADRQAWSHRWDCCCRASSFSICLTVHYSLLAPCVFILSVSVFPPLSLTPSSPSHNLFLTCFYTIVLSLLCPTLHKQELHSQCLLLPMMLAMTTSSVVNIMSLSLWFDKIFFFMQYYTEFKQR